MKKIFWLLIFLVCLSLVSGQDYYSREDLDVKLRIFSGAEIKPTSSSYELSYLKTKLYLYPKGGFQQDVLSLETKPRADKEEDYWLYNWPEPEERLFDYSLEADVRVFDRVHKVREKIYYPFESLPTEVLVYLEPGEVIDSDSPLIRQQASKLAEGEDDLYAVVHKLSSWVEDNVNYDLSDLTAEASQKASWVLENKRGVCDEMTSLIIAMCRSLGIPAKFVSGISYSNDPRFAEPWQMHGWAEVYFPGYGWLPFDAAFGEYGYVDVTHVKLFESADADESKAEYEWLGRNVNLETKKINFEVNVKGFGEETAEKVDFVIEAVSKEVDFGSYNLIKVEVENLKDYYLATTLYLSAPKEVNIFEKKKHVLLRPGEKKSLFWMVKVSDDLMEGYIYTMPIAVVSELNTSKQTSFEVQDGEKVYSKSEIEGLEKSLTLEEEKVLSKNVLINCSFDEEIVYLNEELNLKCGVKNTGNIILRDLKVCLENSCRTENFNLNEEKIFSAKVLGREAGIQEVKVQASNSEISKTAFVEYGVLDEAEIDIRDMGFPGVVGYDDQFEITFVLEKESFSVPEKVKVVLEHEGYPNEWQVEKLEAAKNFEISFLGKNLVAGENDFEIKLEWQDALGKSYSTKENFSLKLENVTPGQRVLLWFRSMGRFFEKLL